MSFLIDTNVLSELRKGARSNPRVRSWFSAVPDEEIFLSVVTLGEIRRGTELIRRRDPRSARRLEAWLNEIVRNYAERILLIDTEVADRWGRLGVPDPVPVVDALLAATALVHDLTLATRNRKDIARTGAKIVDPFAA